MLGAVGVCLLAVVILISLIAYLKILYEWRRKVYIHVPLKKMPQQNHGTAAAAAASATAATAAASVEERVIEYAQAPGPMPWPILGNLALLGQYAVPFEGFTELAKRFGDVYTLTLGTTRCLIVNNLELIREVLNQNGKYFGGRPDFLRFHKLFGGDRNNSLALCDWSHLQQKRRNLARKHCSPRDASSLHMKMSDVGCFEMQEFMDLLGGRIAATGTDIHVKPLIMQTCANMFSQYMCSVRFDYEDVEFQSMVRCFDEIFWEINQGYAVDFLPWLAPFYAGHMGKLESWSAEIRQFILKRIIEQRELTLMPDEPERDFTDALLKSFIEDTTVSRDTIIYMLEDFLGGHSAIGNLVMLALGYIVKNVEIGRRIQEEVDLVTGNGARKVNLNDTEAMPFTVATIFEVLRHSSSPIVPHVATEDASIAGYGVTKDTIVFINNYELNTSEKYWDQPKEFQPQRFLETIVEKVQPKLERKLSDSSDSGVETEITLGDANRTQSAPATKKVLRVRKNIPHFLPFSIGKRTCIGQNLVRGFSFIMLANIMQTYNVSCSDPGLIKMYAACVAVPPDTFQLRLTPRQQP